MDRDLQCDPATLAGPIDKRVVAEFTQQYPLDAAYLQQLSTCHGGVPKIATFKVGRNNPQIGQFLTLLDEKSKLPSPAQPHFENSEMDERVVNSVAYLLKYEHATSRALFGKLFPFASLGRDMCLDRAYVDLLCFDYRDGNRTPPVVLWVADRANLARMTWEDLPEEEAFDDDGNYLSVPWDDFLIPVANSFAEFLRSLK